MLCRVSTRGHKSYVLAHRPQEGFPRLRRALRPGTRVREECPADCAGRVPTPSPPGARSLRRDRDAAAHSTLRPGERAPASTPRAVFPPPSSSRRLGLSLPRSPVTAVPRHEGLGHESPTGSSRKPRASTQGARDEVSSGDRCTPRPCSDVKSFSHGSTRPAEAHVCLPPAQPEPGPATGTGDSLDSAGQGPWSPRASGG